MKYKKILRIILSILLIMLAGFGKAFPQKTGSTKTDKKDYLTIDEAVAANKFPEAVLPYSEKAGSTDLLPRSFSPPYMSVKPIKLFDNLYFVGTNTVGSFLVDTGDGFVMIDTGIGDADISMMVEDMKKLGLDPSRIKLIMITHEHFDHYGGVQFLKKNVCPDAKVAMSLTGWNLLQTVPSEWAYISKRPKSVDIFLSDGMKIKVGNEIFQIVATPGHSPGCLSFIFPLSDNKEPHMAGIMGGSAVWPTQTETWLYKASVEYFKAVAGKAGCDVGLAVHSTERDFAKVRARKAGEPNPLVIGTAGFDTIYLKKYRTRFEQMINSGKVTPYNPL
jgi:metallo-beta-lactamase class B